MNEIFLNWASTSYRKHPAVLAAVQAYLAGNRHANAGRAAGGLGDAAEALACRLALARLFGADRPQQVILTSGVTLSLNMILHGALRPGDHVLATSAEHNAAARPLQLLASRGVITVTWLPCSPAGELDPAAVSAAVRRETRLLVMTHASNVLGTILPAEACFAAAKEHGLITVLDAAQTAGSLPVTLGRHTDVIAFTGHKGLGALAGTGGFVLAPGAERHIEPWLTGGTGSASDSLDQPEFLPDKYESGTANTAGIVSLTAAAEEILRTGTEAIRRHEMALTRRFLSGAASLPVQVHGTGAAEKCAPVVSVTVPGRDPGVLARRLAERWGVITRSGLHCSPLAHRTAGTFPAGTLRFSFGRETTEAEIDAGLDALGEALGEW